MRRLFGFSALTLVFLLGTGGAERPLGLDGPKRQAKYLVGLVGAPGGTRLARVGEDLRPYGARTPNVGFVDSWAIQPSGSIVALAAHPTETGIVSDSLQFASLGSLRLVTRTVTLPGTARALLWANPHRVVALVEECCPGAASVAVVDPGARRVLSKTPLPGTVHAVRRTADALVVLTTPERGIGPARIAVVDAVGTVRDIELSRVPAGMAWPADQNDPIGTQRIPALAVDPSLRRAHVIQPDGPAAEIALDTLDVSYHALAPASLAGKLSGWLQPEAHAKGLNGPAWRGEWLGNGFVAVTGTESSATRDERSGEIMRESPAGLMLVDVRVWTIRTLDAGADQVAQGEGALLATGRRWSSVDQGATGMGLAVYDPDTTARFRIFAGESVWVEAVWRGVAYVHAAEETRVVSLESGRVLGSRAGPVPTLLLAAGPDF